MFTEAAWSGSVDAFDEITMPASSEAGASRGGLVVWPFPPLCAVSADAIVAEAGWDERCSAGIAGLSRLGSAGCGGWAAGVEEEPAETDWPTFNAPTVGNVTVASGLRGSESDALDAVCVSALDALAEVGFASPPEARTSDEAVLGVNGGGASGCANDSAARFTRAVSTGGNRLGSAALSVS